MMPTVMLRAAHSDRTGSSSKPCKGFTAHLSGAPGVAVQLLASPACHAWVPSLKLHPHAGHTPTSFSKQAGLCQSKESCAVHMQVQGFSMGEAWAAQALTQECGSCCKDALPAEPRAEGLFSLHLAATRAGCLQHLHLVGRCSPQRRQRPACTCSEALWLCLSIQEGWARHAPAIMGAGWPRQLLPGKVGRPARPAVCAAGKRTARWHPGSEFLPALTCLKCLTRMPADMGLLNGTLDGVMRGLCAWQHAAQSAETICWQTGLQGSQAVGLSPPRDWADILYYTGHSNAHIG